MVAAERALLELGGLLRRAEVSADGRALFRVGGREADTFYRDRWSYDKVVRSTRIRYPYARGVLVDMYREAKARLPDPVLAWADIQSGASRRRTYQKARGKGGLVRVSWDEALEMVAAAHVHAIKEHGPDRVVDSRPSRRCRWCHTRSARGSSR